MPRRIYIIPLLITASASAVPFAGFRVGMEGYTWPESGGWRATFGMELFLDRRGAALELTYGVNLEPYTVDRLTLGLVRYYEITRRHALRFGFGAGMSYPLTRNWYSWEQRLPRAWWEMNLDGGWRWEFTPGLALLADLRLSVGAGRGTTPWFGAPIKTGVGLTGWLGLVVYP